MKLANAVKIARPIRVIQNSTRRGNQWARISDATTGQVLHTGQLPYIRRVALQRYNHTVSFAK